MVFFCGEALDWVVFEPVQRHLPPMPVVAKNHRLRRSLAEDGIRASLWPSFPRAVIMARHALHRFPSPRIVRVGMRHGAFHFKRFIRPERYNAFDLFVFTSSHEVEEARAAGITCGVAGGFPKLDPLFQPGARETAEAVARAEGLRRDLPTVLFSTTYDGSGLSAVDRWCGRLGELTSRYTVLVTVHPRTSRRFVRVIEKERGVHLIRTPRTWPYLLLADVMVGDTSSILGEFCALDKPIVTFRVQLEGRADPEALALIEEISLRIDGFDEVTCAIERCLADPHALSDARRQANARMFDVLDGAHGARTAGHILRLLRERGVLSEGS